MSCIQVRRRRLKDALIAEGSLLERLEARERPPGPGELELARFQAGRPPRSATVAIRKADGGSIGT